MKEKREGNGRKIDKGMKILGRNLFTPLLYFEVSW